LVLVSKYRRKIFNDGVIAYFKARAKKISELYPKIQFIEVNQDKDHVHMLISVAPSILVGEAVRTIKSISGRELKRKFEYMQKAYWGTDGIWSDGYFVDTVGANEESIKRYIEMQGKEDLGQAQLDL
jgi:putative transposase